MRRYLAGLAALVMSGALMSCSSDGAVGPTSSAAPTTAGTARGLSLPAPTGAHTVGTTELHLIDQSRPDPWVASRRRELMVQLWYPAGSVGTSTLARWMPAKAAAHFRVSTASQLGVADIPDVSGISSHAYLGAPVAAAGRGWPVVLFSPGGSVSRSMGTALVEELATSGFFVIAIDHTYDASEVEFPGGRVETPEALAAPSPQAPGEGTAEVFAKAVRVRVADTRFVLDQLTSLNGGDNPDAEHRELPAGLRGALRLTSIGMFGHSMGGATAAQVMHDDSRVDAGTALDSAMFGSVATEGLARPFMLFAADDNSRASVPSWKTFLPRLRGWHRELHLTGALHYTFTDAAVLLPQFAGVSPVTPEVVRDTIGTIDGQRAVVVQRAYLTAFFAHHLGDATAAQRRLLEGPSAEFPEVAFGVS